MNLKDLHDRVEEAYAAIAIFFLNPCRHNSETSRTALGKGDDMTVILLRFTLSLEQAQTEVRQKPFITGPDRSCLTSRVGSAVFRVHAQRSALITFTEFYCKTIQQGVQCVGCAVPCHTDIAEVQRFGQQRKVDERWPFRE